jgi:hypothetical protein
MIICKNEAVLKKKIIREMQSEITMRYHITLVRMWTGCREKEVFESCWWNCKLVQPLWKIV